jgi:dephospho-CoA kinase
MQPIYLICGVPGSGKSWVCEQLQDKYHYVRHDDHHDKHTLISEVRHHATSAQKPILVDCPFAERELKEKLLQYGISVTPLFVIEPPDVVKRRYEAREKKPVAKNVMTRAVTIQDRAKEWNAIAGNSNEILKYLKDLTNG